jgi:peptide/nickel transport system substrate-binding protein
MTRLRRTFLLASAVAAIAAAGLAGGVADVRAQTTLRVVPQADLQNLDPIWTTAIITKYHGYMVYDTLFAMDENLIPQPQMVESYEVSDDNLTYSFTLRDGLTWHDGNPVTAEDCVASIKRWAKRDASGQMLMERTKELRVIDDKTFEIELAEPFGLVIESLGKTATNVPFMMPKRLAETDPHEQVPEVIGSGPFRFVDEEWVPGTKVVYEKFEEYVPRDEPPSATAGGKVVKVDRVEWIIMPDPQTAISALMAGEVDYYENPPIDLLPVLESAPGVKTRITSPLGKQGILRMNHLHPPFDDPKARQAMYWLVNQENYLQAIVGNPEYYETCPALLVCGSPMETDVASEALMGHDPEKARALFEEAGWSPDQPIVIPQPTDFPELNAATLVTAEALRTAGMTVELQAMDWATLTSRRTVKKPVGEGGWNIFHTYAGGVSASDPVAHVAVSAACDDAWFGWPCDERLEELRDAWATATSLEEKKAIAEDIQARAYEIGLYIPFGQWTVPIAHRDNLEGIVDAPEAMVLWNLEKVGG